MSAFDTHPNASHFSFPYYFDSDEGITFGELNTNWVSVDGDLLIYYDSLTGTDYIDCWCSRWSVDDFSVTIETWVSDSELNTILNNIVPGAAGELYQILGRPHMYDQTWEGNNTLRIVPNRYTSYDTFSDEWQGTNTSTLYKMRNDTIIYIKNITTHPVSYTDWIHIKLEGYVSGSSEL
jgi:hypothetical protein